MDMDKIKAGLVAGSIIVAGFAGAAIHNGLTEPEVIEVPMPVPGPVEIVEINNTVEKLVEVPDQETQEKLAILEGAYERLTDERIDYDQLVLEDAAIENAIAAFEDKAGSLLDIQFDEDYTIVQFYDEQSDVDEVERVIDGRTQEVLVSDVDFKVRVEISDGDTTTTEEFRVNYNLDYESNGDEEISFNVNTI